MLHTQSVNCEGINDVGNRALDSTNSSAIDSVIKHTPNIAINSTINSTARTAPNEGSDGQVAQFTTRTLQCHCLHRADGPMRQEAPNRRARNTTSLMYVPSQKKKSLPLCRVHVPAHGLALLGVPGVQRRVDLRRDKIEVIPHHLLGATGCRRQAVANCLGSLRHFSPHAVWG